MDNSRSTATILDYAMDCSRDLNTGHLGRVYWHDSVAAHSNCYHRYTSRSDAHDDPITRGHAYRNGRPYRGIIADRPTRRNFD